MKRESEAKEGEVILSPSRSVYGVHSIAVSKGSSKHKDQVRRIEESERKYGKGYDMSFHGEGKPYGVQS